MTLINSIMSWVLKKRFHQMELFMKYPIEVQEEWLEKLVSSAQDTAFGKKYGFKDIENYRQFADRVPTHTYEELYPYIDQILKGEQNILWPTEIKWFAKSSGTTNARSKFIPVSAEAIEDCHFKGGKDMLSIYINNYPDANLFSGKNLGVGGSHQINQFDPSATSYTGDVSAVIMQNLPFWAQISRVPSLDIALMSEWESKIDKMARATMDEDVTSLSGVPTWMVVLLQKVLEIKGAKDITEVWPNLELFMHGAVAFDPYRELFRQLIPSPKMRYLETYNASEGFFGIQDLKDAGGEMLLMLDYGIFYEFMPMDQGDSGELIPLSQVELNKNYAMVITTNAGLWRYKIGDTVKFTNLNPYRIRISGRTKHFINAFGEELIIENAERAISKACAETNAVIDNYTAGPSYLGDNGKQGSHEWIIEFQQKPDDQDTFNQKLDQYLREENSDYDAKRYKDLALLAPIIHAVPQGTFYEWMRKRGKLGGQHKVPRLANNREFLDEILG
jgi:hypothetical protein